MALQNLSAINTINKPIRAGIPIKITFLSSVCHGSAMIDNVYFLNRFKCLMKDVECDYGNDKIDSATIAIFFYAFYSSLPAAIY